ncbi:myelin protein zero-like protein 2 isoform X1 [Oreochromis niloticus]|uniref:myelin protein zero-like protein 2 isoform X1 n=1 Tax=Oreochromis niloticus TaxID=8128 RepID=UPI000904A0EE|nr:myelin protein zero-like protein 2 isoform X1 [Oreochromis niloticus]
MAAGTSASLCWLIFVVASVSADQKTITAESGQNVILTCQVPNKNIIVVKWSRADLGEEYMLYYKDEQFITDNQHPSFKNRVDLWDRYMKGGDVSLILKNVTINDNGTYECQVAQREQNKRPSLKLISIIYLHVAPPGQTVRQVKNRSVGLKVHIPVVVFLVVVVVAFVSCLNFRKDKPQSQDSHCPTTETQIEMSENFLNSESPADEHNDRNDPEENSCHQHSTRIPDVTLTLENELLHHPIPQETAGLLPNSDIRVQ